MSAATLPQTPDSPAVAASPPRPALMVAGATVGLALNWWAWLLAGPFTPNVWDRPGYGPWTFAFVTAAPFVVGAVGSMPVGVLTDRYGARWIYPIVSAATALPVVVFGFVDSLPALAVAGCAAGAGGTAYAVGAALISRWYPARSRGLVIGFLGLGAAGGAMAGLVTLQILGINGKRTVALILAALLVGYAGVAALLIRDQPSRQNGATAVGVIAAVLRLPAARRLTVLCAVTFGALTTFALYTPAYLHAAYQVSWTATLMPTVALVAVAGGARLVGGWLADRTDMVRTVAASLALAAPLGILLAFHPAKWWVATMAIAGVFALVGLASGVVLALVAKAAPAGWEGTVNGTVVGVGRLAGLLPALLLSGVYDIVRSHAVGFTMLSCALLGTVWYLWRRDVWSGLPLAQPAASAADAVAIDTGEATTTVVAITPADAAVPAVVARLAELATRDEVVAVYGDAESGHPRTFVSRLRAGLPRHTVMAVLVDPSASETHAKQYRAECALLHDLLEIGTVPVVLTTAADPGIPATMLAAQLNANRVVRIHQEPSGGASVRLAWINAPAATGAPTLL